MDPPKNANTAASTACAKLWALKDSRVPTNTPRAQNASVSVALGGSIESDAGESLVVAMGIFLGWWRKVT